MEWDELMAIFSEISYQSSKDRRSYMVLYNLPAEGWYIEYTYNHAQAVFLFNPRLQQKVVAFRGTKDINDLLNDAVLAIKTVNQTELYQYFRPLVKTFLNDPKYFNYNTTLTGHSLGGALAHNMGIDLKISSVAFNPGTSPISEYVEILNMKLSRIDPSEFYNFKKHRIYRLQNDPISLSKKLNPFAIGEQTTLKIPAGNPHGLFPFINTEHIQKQKDKVNSNKIDYEDVKSRIYGSDFIYPQSSNFI